MCTECPQQLNLSQRNTGGNLNIHQLENGKMSHGIFNNH